MDINEYIFKVTLFINEYFVFESTVLKFLRFQYRKNRSVHSQYSFYNIIIIIENNEMFIIINNNSI